MVRIGKGDRHDDVSKVRILNSGATEEVVNQLATVQATMNVASAAVARCDAASGGTESQEQKLLPKTAFKDVSVPYFGRICVGFNATMRLLEKCTSQHILAVCFVRCTKSLTLRRLLTVACAVKNVPFLHLGGDGATRNRLKNMLNVRSVSCFCVISTECPECGGGNVVDHMPVEVALAHAAVDALGDCLLGFLDKLETDIPASRF